MSTWLNVELDDDLEAMFDELKESEQIDGNSKMTRELIKWAHDEFVEGEYWYDPREERMTPIDTDERQEIFFRYDNPAINPEHISKWPRDKDDKAELLAAICRYVGASSHREVADVITNCIGEGDPVKVETGGGKEDKTRGRNIVEYASRVRKRVNTTGPADNLPSGFHGSGTADDEDDEKDVFDEWLEESVPKEARPEYDSVGDWVESADRLADIQPAAEPLENKLGEGEALVEALEEAGRDDDVEEVEEVVDKLKTALDEMEKE